MKKLLFVLALTFIGQQAFSQICLVTISSANLGSCGNSTDRTITVIDPTGTETYTCIDYDLSMGGLGQLNQILNSVTSQGYKLITTSLEQGQCLTVGSPTVATTTLISNATFIFAIP